MGMKAWIGTALLAVSLGAVAQTPDTARLLASNCANCHGTDGRSQGGMPSLAGAAQFYLLQQMQDFKAGKRSATLMHQLFKGYTDAELEMLAAYFSALKN